MVQAIGERFEDFVAGNREAARYAFAHVAAAQFDFLDLRARERGTYGLLDGFGSLFTDRHAVVATDVVDNRVVEFIAAHAHGTLVHNTAERNDAYFGGASANIDHHRPGRLGYGQTGAGDCGHKFFDQVDLRTTGALCGFPDCASFDLSGPARNANNNPRRWRKHARSMRHADEALDHLPVM